MTDRPLQLDDLTGLTVADRYRLGARRAAGLLSAVFDAFDVSLGDDAPALLLQLVRGYAGELPAPPVELHDHLLLEGGFSADVLIEAEVTSETGATDAARFLVARTDTALGLGNGESTAPELPTPMETTVFEAAWLQASDMDELDAVTDGGSFELPEEGTLDGTEHGAEDLGDLGDLADLADLADLGDLGGPDATIEGAAASEAIRDTAMEMPILIFDRKHGG